MVPYLTDPHLTALPGIRHGFFTREGGVSTGIFASLNCGLGSKDHPENVRENRARIANAMGVAPQSLVTAYQVHGTAAIHVDTPWRPDARPKADALVADRPGIAIAVGIADCAPILFADADARVVAAAHAGWRGAFDGILESAVEAMESRGAQRERIVAAIGPTISRASYEVGPEFIERFQTADIANRRFFYPAEKPGHAFFDLPGYAGTRLRRLKLAAVANLDRCTYTGEERFFSYRRSVHRGEPDYGRQLAAIVIEP
jgi:YfiH family protein